MGYFQLHLTDNQRFSFPSTAFPELDDSNSGRDVVGGVSAFDQRDFLNEMDAHIKSRGKTTLAWEGTGLGVGANKVSTDVIFMNWHTISIRAGDMLAAGYRVINAAWDPMYIVDHYLELRRLHRISAGDKGHKNKVFASFSKITEIQAFDTTAPANPSPPHGATEVPRYQALSWDAVPAATGYQVTLWEAGTPRDRPLRRRQLHERTTNPPRHSIPTPTTSGT